MKRKYESTKSDVKTLGLRREDDVRAGQMDMGSNDNCSFSGTTGADIQVSRCEPFEGRLSYVEAAVSF